MLALARGTTTRLTSDPSSDWFPVWSPDGSRLFFGSGRTGRTTIFQKIGVSPEEVFVDGTQVEGVATYPTDVSVDARLLMYQQSTSRGYDMGVLSLSGDLLAREIGTSRSVLADRFTHLVGLPPMRYLTHWRLQLAAGMLSNSAAKVSAVAQDVGYESEAAFSRAFKKLVGVSPAAWRR